MKFWEKCRELEIAGTAFSVVTLLAGRGHIPQNLGAKAVVTKEGLAFGTVGGGKVEAKAIRHCQSRLSEGAILPELLTWNLTKDVGMTCGGEMSFLFETFAAPSWKIAIFGAGHVAQALIPLLSGLDCRLWCIDPRQEWLSRLPHKPGLEKIFLEKPEGFVPQLTGGTFFLCLSQGHSFDVPVLTEIFRHFPDAPFVGVIGSDTKAAAIRRDLLGLGVSAQFIEKIRCPVGLKLGSNHPLEIAVSITAQLLQERDISPAGQ